jgi:hypothetical protein
MFIVTIVLFIVNCLLTYVIYKTFCECLFSGRRNCILHIQIMLSKVRTVLYSGLEHHVVGEVRR